MIAALGLVGVVSFSCRAETLPNLAAELCKASGLTLSIPKECANDVLLVSARNVSIDDLLAEIARVDAGVWKKVGAGWRFSTDVIARRAEARGELGERAKRVRETIAEQRTLLAKEESESGQEAAAPIYASLSPEDRRLAQEFESGFVGREEVLSLLEGVNPELLVLEQGQRAVFSTDPTRAQLELGAKARSVINGYLVKLNKELEIGRKIVAAFKKKETVVDAAQSNLDPITDYQKADLVVEPSEEADGFDAHLTLYAADGHIASQSRSYAFRHRVLRSNLATTTKVDPSDAAVAFRAMNRSRADLRKARVEIPALLVPFLNDPEHYDPLSLSVSDELLAYAGSIGKPLVAVVPDSAFQDTDSRERTLEEFAQSIEEGETMKLTRNGDWLEVTPANPATERQYRCDRVALGTLLRSCLTKSFPTLSEFADFTARVDYENNAVAQAYVNALVPGYGDGGLSTERSWNLYRMYGQLSDDQRASLIGGGKLPLSALSQSALSAFNEFAYSSWDPLRYGISPAPLLNRFPSADRLPSDPPAHISLGKLPPERDMDQEATELLPGGVEKDGYLEMKVYQEPFVSPVGPAAEGVSLPEIMDVDFMAERLAHLSDPTFGHGDPIASQKFKLGSRDLYVLTVHPSRKSFLTGRLYDLHLNNGSPTLAQNDLPLDWRSELERRIPGWASRKAALVDGPATP